MTRTEALADLRLLLDKVRFSIERSDYNISALDGLVEAVALLTQIVESVAGSEK